MQNKKHLKKVYVNSTEGCEEASLDTQRVINLIKSYGSRKNFIYTKNIRQADLVIYNACAHLQKKQNESITNIKKLQKMKKKSAKIIVWGCLPKIDPISLKKIYNGPLIGPEESWDFFKNQFNPSNNKEDINANTLNNCTMPQEISNKQPSKREKITNLYNYFESRRDWLLNVGEKKIVKNRWYIKIVSGCKNNCTYCSDLLAYKTVKSQPIETIINQFELGLKRGYRHFHFVGRELGSYGYDIDSTLAQLLEKIIEKFSKNNFKISLINISPNSLIELYPDLQKTLASKKINWLGSHIQSGSSRILKLMGKNFSLNKWTETIKDIEKKYPYIKLETSIMVGFPSETKKDFEKSANLLNNLFFDKVNLYKYNERPNLPSKKIKNQIPESVKNKRYYEMKYHSTFCRIKNQTKNGKLLTIPTLNLFFDLVNIPLRSFVEGKNK